MGIVLLVILILLLLGAFPREGAYNATWGYGPPGIFTVLLIILIILMLTGRI